MWTVGDPKKQIGIFDGSPNPKTLASIAFPTISKSNIESGKFNTLHLFFLIYYILSLYLRIMYYIIIFFYAALAAPMQSYINYSFACSLHQDNTTSLHPAMFHYKYILYLTCTGIL